MMDVGYHFPGTTETPRPASFPKNMSTSKSMGVERLGSKEYGYGWKELSYPEVLKKGWSRVNPKTDRSRLDPRADAENVGLTNEWPATLAVADLTRRFFCIPRARGEMLVGGRLFGETLLRGAEFWRCTIFSWRVFSWHAIFSCRSRRAISSCSEASSLTSLATSLKVSSVYL